MKATSSYENKALKADLENKAEAPHFRCPTGRENAEVRVRKIDDGPVPMLDIREFRRSPADLSNEMHPTAHGIAVQVQYGEVLLEAIQRAIDTSNTVPAAA